MIWNEVLITHNHVVAASIPPHLSTKLLEGNPI